MKIKLRIWTTMIVLLAALATTIPPASALAAESKKPKILVLTHWTAFRHPSLPLAEKTIAEMGEKSGVFEAVGLKGYDQKKDTLDLSMITPEYLSQFSALFFFTQGDPPLTDAQKKAIVDFVRGGKGYIGTHCGADSFYNWPDYGLNLSGAYFNGHGSTNEKQLILNVEDTKHPATKMLGTTWTIADEFYTYKPESLSRDHVRVLLSVDSENSNLEKQKMTKGGDYPLAWCKTFEKGRCFYTALGHRDDVWTNPVFQDHLMGGIKWALGLEPGDATPTGTKK